jgi:hypothetical protein
LTKAVIANQGRQNPLTPEALAAALVAAQGQGQQAQYPQIADDEPVPGAVLKTVLAQYGNEVAGAVGQVAGAIKEMQSANFAAEIDREIDRTVEKYPGVNKLAVSGMVLGALREGRLTGTVKQGIEECAKMLHDELPKGVEWEKLPREKKKELAVQFAKELADEDAKAKQKQNFNPGGGPAPTPGKKRLDLDDEDAWAARLEAGRQANLRARGK